MFVQNPNTTLIREEILPFDISYVPEYFIKKSEVELHDTPERRVQALRQLREAAKKDKYMKHMEFDEDFLLQFLRARKFNIGRSFSSLKAFAHLRRKNPKMFTDFSYEITVKTMKDDIVTVLPYRCHDGCTIILVQLDNWNPEEFPIEEVKRMSVIMLLQTLRNPMTQINGFKAIFDVKSNPIRHLRYCTPHNLYLIYHGIQECIPGKYKGVHFINDSVTFKAAWFVIRPFVSDKLKKRIYFHASSEKLLEFFPRSVLPEKYGGDLTNYDMTAWLRRVMQPDQLNTIGGGPAPSRTD